MTPTRCPIRGRKVFFKTQRARLADQRRSKYGQKVARTDLPSGALAVFLGGRFSGGSGGYGL